MGSSQRNFLALAHHGAFLAAALLAVAGPLRAEPAAKPQPEAGVSLSVTLNAGVPLLAEIANDALSYEPARRRLVLTSRLNLLGANRHLTLLGARTLVIETRTLKTRDLAFSYIVTEDAQVYGLVPTQELDSHSQEAPAMESPRGFLAALASISSGRAKKDAFGTWTENSGVKHVTATGAAKIIAITTDLCPNFAKFEQGFFDDLADLGKVRGAPIPVTAFVSGLWLNGSSKRRATEVTALRQIAAANSVALAFGNHSYTHPYLKGAVSLARNFLLKPGVDLKHETLGNELSLMKNELNPAPLFRFPGLITNPAEERAVRDSFNLVVVGSGAWPGVGEPVNFGDVVLVHANGGEHQGITRFEDWIRQNRAAIINGEINFASASVLARP